jgi:hypothetical protein
MKIYNIVQIGPKAVLGGVNHGFCKDDAYHSPGGNPIPIAIPMIIMKKAKTARRPNFCIYLFQSIH